jgi:hypothetical protein
MMPTPDDRVLRQGHIAMSAELSARSELRRAWSRRAGVKGVIRETTFEVDDDELGLVVYMRSI